MYSGVEGIEMMFDLWPLPRHFPGIELFLCYLDNGRLPCQSQREINIHARVSRVLALCFTFTHATKRTESCSITATIAFSLSLPLPFSSPT